MKAAAKRPLPGLAVGYVHQRLALFDSKKRGKRGPRWANEHNYAWFKGLGVHSLAGSIRWQPAATAVT